MLSSNLVVFVLLACAAVSPFSDANVEASGKTPKAKKKNSTFERCFLDLCQKAKLPIKTKEGVSKIGTPSFFITKPLLSQARALVYPKVFVSLGIQIFNMPKIRHI
ncbi:MAG: hypothetical protein J6C87_10300, partial [Bacteroides sp.]|nr:hypothetical protein [Bacteroides sp.]